MNILFVIILVFATFASSQDALSGFKQCKHGDFPNKITLFTYTPNPVVAGQEVTVRMAGKAAVTIENGATFQNTGFYQNKQIFQHNDDFCKEFVIPSGFTCPVNGDFDFTVKFPVDTSPDDPKNTVLEFGIRTLCEFFNITKS